MTEPTDKLIRIRESTWRAVVEALEIQEDMSEFGRAVWPGDAAAYRTLMVKWFGSEGGYVAPELGLPRFHALRKGKRRTALKLARKETE